MDACLFALGATCQLDSSATASWVQALGSIAAIAFAWHVGRRDGRIRAEREAAEDRRAAEARLGWLHSARATIEAAAAAVRAAEIQATAVTLSGGKRSDGGLAAVAAELAAIPPDMLGHGEAITTVVETRRSIANCQRHVDHIRLGGGSDAIVWQAMKDATSHAQARIVAICLAEGKKLGR